MLNIPALIQVSGDPTLLMGWRGGRNYGKTRFMLDKVNIPISNVQDCRCEKIATKTTNNNKSNNKITTNLLYIFFGTL